MQQRETLKERWHTQEQLYLNVTISDSLACFAGGSLGPEAALLSLCGAAVSFVAKRGLGYQHRQLRNCAIMGMTAGLAAFFGVALGGKMLRPPLVVLAYL